MQINPSRSLTRSLKGWHGLTIAGVALLLIIPAIAYGVFAAYDLPAFHLRWSKQFSDQLWAGDLYPRWLLNMNLGLGSPTFFFYAPVPFYITGFLRPLIFGADPYGWHQLTLGAYTALFASGIAAYIWLKQLTNQTAALVTAILYMVAPYHLTYDLYWRFAYAEFWSFVWFPLILYFCQRLLEGRRLAVIGFAIAEALLIMTHLPSFLMFFPVPIFYVLWMASRQQRLKACIGLGLGLGLAIGLSAIYWLPALSTQDWISMKSALEQNPFFLYKNNFLFRDKGIEFFQNYQSYLTVVTLLMVELALCAFAITNGRSLQGSSLIQSSQIRKQTYFWLGVAVIAFLMTTPLSKPVWDVLPPLQKIQFPWRFNAILTIATVTLIAPAISTAIPTKAHLSDKRVLKTIGVFLGVGLVLAAIALIPAQPKVLIPWNRNVLLWVTLLTVLAVIVSTLRLPRNVVRQRPLTIGVLLTLALLFSSGVVIKKRLCPPYQLATELAVSRDAEEYRTKWVQENFYNAEGLKQLVNTVGATSAKVDRGTVQVQQWHPHRLVLQTNAPTDTWLTLKQFYYPSWQATLANPTTPLAMQPSPSGGLLQVRVPRGEQQVIVTRQVLAIERPAQWLSGLSAGAIVLLLLRFKPRKPIYTTQEKRPTPPLLHR